MAKTKETWAEGAPNGRVSYLSRDAFLVGATTLAERDHPAPFLGGTVRIRELWAYQRHAAFEAAETRDEEGTPTGVDEALFRALVVQQGVIDPATGEPLLQPADVPMLAQKGREALGPLARAILNLSESTPAALFRGDQAPDDRQSDTGTGVGVGATDAG